MNRRTALKLTGSAALLGAASSEPEFSPMQDQRTAHLITTDTAEAIYNRHKIEATWGWIRHDVDVYRFNYSTNDVLKGSQIPSKKGPEITASGALLVPKGVESPRLLSYFRGTIIAGSGERIAPSYYERKNTKDEYDDNYEMSYIAATLASAGYIVVAPDGIGFGATKHLHHPYMHAGSLAWTTLDMLRAARVFLAQKGIQPKDNRVFVTGWSEGGLAGMALHKLIQETCPAEFPVAASSLLAGTHSLSGQLHVFCNYEEEYPEANTNYWKLRTMCEFYALRRPFDRTVLAPYAKALEKNVMALVPKNPRLVLDREFRERFLKGDEPEMESALQDNDRFNWKPQAPVFLHHGTHDDIVPFFCAQMAYEAMRAKGATIKLYPYLGQDHYQPANNYVVRTLSDFDEL